MYKLFALFCFALFVRSVYSAVALQPPVDKPPEFACEEGCYNPDLNMVLEYEVRYSPPPQLTGCLQYYCQRDGWTQIFSCGAIAAGKGCKVVDGDLNAPYPGCCKTIECDGSHPTVAVA